MKNAKSRKSMRPAARPGEMEFVQRISIHREVTVSQMNVPLIFNTFPGFKPVDFKDYPSEGFAILLLEGKPNRVRWCFRKGKKEQIAEFRQQRDFLCRSKLRPLASYEPFKGFWRLGKLVQSLH